MDKSLILSLEGEFFDIFLLPKEKMKHSRSCLEHPVKGKCNITRMCKFLFRYRKSWGPYSIP